MCTFFILQDRSPYKSNIQIKSCIISLSRQIMESSEKFLFFEEISFRSHFVESVFILHVYVRIDLRNYTQSIFLGSSYESTWRGQGNRSFSPLTQENRLRLLVIKKNAPNRSLRAILIYNSIFICFIKLKIKFFYITFFLLRKIQ